MRFCPNCGYQLEILGKFCPECGGSLADSTSVPAQGTSREETIKLAVSACEAGDLTGAARLLEPLAQAGDVEAMDILGVVSSDAGDVETAVHWFTLVANEGFDYGASYAGTKALGPSGVDCNSADDRQIARRYLTISAEVGNTVDQSVLAHLFIVDKDYDSAQKWWTRIIAEANPEYPGIVTEAQGNLEYMFQDPGYVAHVTARRLGDRS